MAVADFFARLALERPERNTLRLAQNAQATVEPRSPGWALIALVAAYESTLDSYYLEAAQAVVEILATDQQEDGQWVYAIPANELEGSPRRTKTFMSAIVLRGLGDFYRITGDGLARSIFLKGVDFLINELWDEEAGGYAYIDDARYRPPEPSNTNFLMLDALAYAYEMTGDMTYLNVAARGFAAGMAPYVVRQLPIGAENVGKTVAQLLRHTPHALAVILGSGD